MHIFGGLQCHSIMLKRTTCIDKVQSKHFLHMVTLAFWLFGLLVSFRSFSAVGEFGLEWAHRDNLVCDGWCQACFFLLASA